MNMKIYQKHENILYLLSGLACVLGPHQLHGDVVHDLKIFGNMKIFQKQDLATYPYAIKNQRKARNAPSRGLWVP